MSPFNGITEKLLIDGGIKITDVKLDELTFLFVGDFVKPLNDTYIIPKQ